MASIRRTLLTWYGVILAGTVGGLGATLYVHLERSTWELVETDLRAHGQALAASLEPAPDGHFELDLSDALVQYFSDERRGPFYSIHDRHGRLVDSSHSLLRPGRPPIELRIVNVPGPAGSTIAVGQVVTEQAQRLRDALGAIAVAGGAALILGLVGGWFLAGRTLAPVRSMTATAAEVTASNLALRLDAARVPAELAPLASTFNGALDRLEAAFDRQTRFTADASHELRTPLAILTSQIELALRKERSAAEYRETIETCHRAAQRMKSVIESLLTLARADANELTLAREKFDLKPLVEETVALLRPMAAERNVTVGVAAEPCDFTGDRERLRDVVTNLVTNAIRYNRPNGRVDVALKGGVLTVADTGVGIPEKDRPHIFERFYRVDKARSRELGGTGLGLAITKWIVEAHGGSIAFTSREGEGTTFTVRFA